ncbi:LPS export ABC transporter permease LptF [Paracoccus aerodenitrificans]|uniref:LPS export ABC transporter permease LptF n=1 Tax=Paracoccus aerodenitrificans TaxID=3017781 RepID=UPI0022F09EAC|nr:LPS export ABC transporter permease LptF [Paracoccus aerodenitrificans]WBU64167.1 LPS export ABC transporter permease LptF [Paracoccus aerodenitrificans]
MNRIDRYILKLMLIFFGFFALVLVAVYWVNRAVSLFENLIADGQTALVVLEFTLLTLPLVISVVLPVAAFAATAYGTNRLSGDSELVAMQAAGLSPWRLARPVLAFGILVALMVTMLVHAIVPMARAQLAARQDQISENVTAQLLNPGVFQYPAPGLTLFIREMSPLGELGGLFLEDARDPASVTSYSADSALILRAESGPMLLMMNGVVQALRPGADSPLLSVTRFEEMTYDLGGMIGGSDSGGRDLRDYSTRRLLTPDQELLDATGATPQRARLEAHERLAKPLLSPVAAMLGFATLLVGGFSRFGVWRQVAWAIVALIFVQLLTNWAANRAGDEPSLWPIVYLPAAIGGLICAVLLWISGRRKRPRYSGSEQESA